MVRYYVTCGGVLWYHVSICRPSVFLFPDDNLSKCLWIFTKLGMYIDIVEFGIANGQISSIFDKSYLPVTHPYFCFQKIFCINIGGFSPNLVYALILWRSDLGLLIGKFCNFWLLSAWTCPDYRFRTIMSKYQWIFTKLAMCIDIVEICFGIAIRQILSIFDRVICPVHKWFPFNIFWKD